MYSIYKITNLINSKIYIGQTKNDVQIRFHQHCNKHSCCTKLKNAIQKYGKENFICETLCVVETKEEANKLEIEYINKYKSKEQEYGYNLADGGYTTNPTTRKKVICLETKEIYDSVSELANKFNTRVDTIARVCRGKRPTYKGLHYSYLDDNGYPTNTTNTKPSKIKVKCVETGEVFNSIKEASKKFDKSRFAVGYACQDPKRTCGGYHWEYYKEVA